MKWIKATDYKNFNLNSCVMSIGNFDGLHLGHQKLIDELLKAARSRGLSSLVMTFHPHPLQVLKPHLQAKFLFSKEDLSQQLEKLGVNYLLEIPFSRELAAMKAEDFLTQHLISKLHPQEMIVGYDFCFGKNKEGDVHFLQRKTAELGIGLQVVEAVSWRQAIISSSRIRQALALGQVQDVKQMLGRY
ncbi:MAG: FAD synthetase family protein, partial [Bdellovibrionales bacterium]|nr:FAD synthetase family protein [Bdellovibrionales bacterium]